MKIREITEGVGRITKQNQTHDVGPDEVTKQAAKFGNKVDKDGRPPTLSKKVKGSSTNVMFNLGMTENFAKDSTTAIKLIKKYHQTGDEQDAFAAIKHGWNFIKNPKIRSIIVNIVKKVSTEGGYPEWNDTVAYIKKNTGIDVSNVNENFADGKKKVQEAFDNPYPIKWLSLRPGSSSSAKAKLDDGSELEIHFADDDAGYYDIEFLRSGSMKVSGEGDEFRVFATVQAAILEWWKQADKKYVRAISFSADKGDNNRSKLYKRFAEMWAKKIKWQFKSNDGRRDVEFSLIRPKAVEENFADGKKKGKSRPGRVKKSGASCNGTVTQLRKRAKNASGEKAKMYHWCANMKGGKK